MPDQRRIKLIITAISDGDNIMTHDKDGDATTGVFDLSVAEDVSTYEISIAFKRAAEFVETEIDANHRR